MRISIKIIRYTNLMAVTLILLSACSRENYLDIQPKGAVIPTTLEDYRSLLDQVNPPELEFTQPLSQGFNEKHAISYYLNDDNFISSGLVGSFGLPRSAQRAYLFEDSFYSALEDDGDWNNYYKQIYTANIILDGLQDVTNATTAQIAELVAEAKLHRAYAYFNLVNLYGLHYNPASAGSDLGVPIREGIALEDVDLTRASVQEVYDLILDDITEGIPNLEDIQPLNRSYRPSKAAAYGLLSKVLLFQGNYAEALENVDLALDLYGVLRDINDDPFNSFNPELKSLPLQLNDDQIIWYKDIFQNTFVQEEFLEIYEDNDIRKQWFIEVRAFFGDDVDGFYFGAGNDNFFYSDGITTPDLYLIRAECNARLGNTAAANAALNALRENRFETGTHTPLNITDNAELLDFVKEERRRETVGGPDRMFDIKRYNLFDEDGISLTHILGSVSATLEANSKNWAIPIGSKYIQQNPEIEQNPRD
ncbi:RagB/SusD family nutrient uptake outer membrane protein [Maribacter sp. 2210JD10-5]|uniref:RagB/SusD family nutrient uptake outer membrane protein n=1 Tax=Maribacter sp. 2210JD10-5 TaxID=3386272 RepID=UPI0039BC5778